MDVGDFLRELGVRAASFFLAAQVSDCEGKNEYDTVNCVKQANEFNLHAKMQIAALWFAIPLSHRGRYGSPF